MKNKKITNYLSFVKFSHTIFAMPFALMGFCFAAQQFGFKYHLFFLVLLCMVFARNAAMGFNRLIDHHIDRLNPRTSNREIPSGKISIRSAFIFVILNAVCFVLSTYWLNLLVFYLSPIALFVVLGYSFTKRFTWFCHIVLGIGLSLASIGAYLAVAGQWNVVPILWSFAVLFWVSGFDIIYALQDIEFDKKNALNSIPVKLGIQKSIYLSIVFHVFSVLFLILAYFKGMFGIYYLIGLFLFSILLIFQHLIVKDKDLSKINIAFFTTNGLASVLFASFVIFDIFF